jgi:hypothetical protein
VDRLGQVSLDTRIDCFAWALMRNHVHLLIRSGLAPISTVKSGIKEGKKSELVGGGLIRSLGGWSVVKFLGGMSERITGDERILGDGRFVEQVLTVSQERLEHRYSYHSKG